MVNATQQTTENTSRDPSWEVTTTEEPDEMSSLGMEQTGTTTPSEFATWTATLSAATNTSAPGYSTINSDMTEYTTDEARTTTQSIVSDTSMEDYTSNVTWTVGENATTEAFVTDDTTMHPNTTWTPPSHITDETNTLDTSSSSGEEATTNAWFTADVTPSTGMSISTTGTGTNTTEIRNLDTIISFDFTTFNDGKDFSQEGISTQFSIFFTVDKLDKRVCEMTDWYVSLFSSLLLMEHLVVFICSWDYMINDIIRTSLSYFCSSGDHLNIKMSSYQ